MRRHYLIEEQRKDDDTVYLIWRQELLKEWFTAEGFRLMIRFEYDLAVEIIFKAAYKLVRKTGENRNLLYTLNYLYELLPYKIDNYCIMPDHPLWAKNKLDNIKTNFKTFLQSPVYALLITAISFAYDLNGNEENSFKFSMFALKLLLSIEQDWDKDDRYMLALCLSGSAYGITKLEEKPKDCDYSKCRHFAFKCYKHAEKILTTIDEDKDQSIVKLKTEICGNIGSYWLSRANDATV